MRNLRSASSWITGELRENGQPVAPLAPYTPLDIGQPFLCAVDIVVEAYVF